MSEQRREQPTSSDEQRQRPPATTGAAFSRPLRYNPRVPRKRSRIERELHLHHMVRWMRDQPGKPSRQAAARELNRHLATEARAAALQDGATADEAEEAAQEAQLSEAVAAHQIRAAEIQLRKASDMGMAERLRRDVADIEQAMEDSYDETERVKRELYGHEIEVEQRPGVMAELTILPPKGGEDRDTLRERLDRQEERRMKLRAEARAVVGGLEWERREQEIRAALKGSERLPEGEGRRESLMAWSQQLLDAVMGHAVNPVTQQLVAGNRNREAGALQRLKVVQAMPADGAGPGGTGEPAAPARMLVEHRTVNGEEQEPN